MHNNSDGARVWDAAIIGAGVTGSFIARELTRKGLSVALLDKAGDVCMGASKANSAIVHGGFDATPNTLKALLNLRGCQLMPKVADELSVDYEQVGSLVLGFSEEERVTLEELLERGRANGVSELSIIER
ncbi:MAG: FAD-dependent oxidoreductase, partial [Oscillospiraceae bacterium]|nr:FAD-dependent oxidoreductase [Oscillospiraceae bacterium]